MAYKSTVIHTYISKKGTASSIKDGEKIYEKKQLVLKNFDFRKEDALVSLNEGDGHCIVDIQNFKYLSTLKTSCACDNDFETLCRHEVAALLLLDNHLKHYNPEMEFSKKYNKVNPNMNNQFTYTIADFKDIKSIDLSQHYNADNFKKYKVNLIKVKANEIELEVTPENYFFSQDYQEVILQSKNNALEIHCTCKSQGLTLCRHTNAVIDSLQKHSNLKFLKVLEYDYLEKLKKKYTSKLGLKVAQFDDFFRIDYDSDIVVYPSKNAKGLISMKNGDHLKTIEAFSAEITAQKTHDFDEAYLSDKNYTFYVSLNFKDDKISFENISFDLIMAQEGKSVAFKNYKPYNSQNCTPLTQNQAIIKQFIENYKGDLFDGYNPKFTHPNDPELFVTVHGIIDLLRQEKNVFVYNHAIEDKVVRKKEIYAAGINSATVKSYLKVVKEDLFYALKLYIQIDEQHIELDSKEGGEVIPNGLYWRDNQLYRFGSYDNYIATKLFLKEYPVLRAVKEDVYIFIENVIQPLGQHIEIVWDANVDLYRETDIMRPTEQKIFLTETDAALHLTPIQEYENGVEVKISSPDSKIELDGEEIILYERDFVVEEAFKQKMVALHEGFNIQSPLPYYAVPYTDVFKGGWFFNAFEQLKQENIEVYGLSALRNLKYSPQKATFSTQISSGIDWFDIDIDISFGDYKVPLKDIRQAALKKENFVKLGDGKYGVLPEEYVEKIQQYFRAGQILDGKLVVSKMKFNLIEEVFDAQDHQLIFEEIAAKKQKIQSYKEIKSIDIPSHLNATLRDYQKEGYNWLNFLDEFGWGGILADDMGLGKTIQILTFLLKIVENSDQANLVIVPTSLLFNWQKEIDNFTPSLKVLYHYGTGRQKRDVDFDAYDIVITSYGLLTRDIELLRNHVFNYIILDESQAIKNPNSLRYKAAKLLQANNRISMSGTPIENNTFDLFAQFNFVNPGFFESIKNFKDQYSIPIDTEGNVERAKELQSLINPFLLRRTKESVAKELPEKTENYLFCDMSKDQEAIYKSFKLKYRDLLMGKIEEEGLGKSKMYVLEGLTKLRQICDSPAILNEDVTYPNISSKIDTLVEHVKEKTGQHKILIFSQFVKMLKLVENEMNKLGVEYEYLDGSCTPKQRELSVANFQDNENCRVFLISLKAGGLGLNLTAADYVYIIDPWWNPAVESQAMDRSHRIGQTKKVMVYRMICKGTIEEKIMEYQSRKKKVAEDIISTDESYMKNIQKEDIAQLFG